MATLRTSRIIRRAEVDPATLLKHPDNVVIHTFAQQEQMAALLKQYGWVDTVVVNARTGRIIDGELRVAIAVKQGMATIPVSYLDLTDAEERKALLYLKRTGMLARIDAANLAAVLASLVTDDAEITAMSAAFAKSAGVYALQERQRPREVVEWIDVQVGPLSFQIPWAIYVHWRGQLQALYRTRHDTIDWVILVRLGLEHSDRPV